MFLFLRANQRVEELQRGRNAEVARMEAVVRKAETRINSLEQAVEQKSRENKELNAILDELIAKVGK